MFTVEWDPPEREEASPDSRARDFRDTVGRFPTGVGVVTAHHAGVRHAATTNSFTSVSLAPLMVSVSLAPSSATLRAISKSGLFGVSILEVRRGATLSRHFARSVPVGGDKFEGSGAEDGPRGVPLLLDRVAWFVCDVERVVRVGDHDVVFGVVFDFGDPIGLGVTDAVVFCGGRYWAIGDELDPCAT